MGVQKSACVDACHAFSTSVSEMGNQIRSFACVFSAHVKLDFTRALNSSVRTNDAGSSVVMALLR